LARLARLYYYVKELNWVRWNNRGCFSCWPPAPAQYLPRTSQMVITAWPYPITKGSSRAHQAGGRASTYLGCGHRGGWQL